MAIMMELAGREISYAAKDLSAHRQVEFFTSLVGRQSGTQQLIKLRRTE
jgi:hypothetical protein